MPATNKRFADQLHAAMSIMEINEDTAADKAAADKAAADKAAADKAEKENADALEKAKGGSGGSGGPGGSTGRPNRPGTVDNEVVGNYRWNAGDYQWEQYTGF